MKMFLLFVVSFISFLQAQASTSVAEVIDTDRTWSVSAFSLATVEAEAAQRGGARTSTYNYASINYKTGDDTHFAFRIPFTYQTAGFDSFNEDENQKQGSALADLIIDYTDASTLLPGEFEVFSRFRVELPTSKASNASKKIGALRTDFIISRFLTRGFELEYWPIFTWNIQTQTVYENPELDNNLSHTKMYELDHRLTLWYKAHQRFSVGFFAGGEDDWYSRSKINDTRRQREGRLGEHILKLGPAVRYTLNRNFNFIFNISNSVPLWGFTEERTGEFNDLGRFRPEHTEFTLLSFVSF